MVEKIPAHDLLNAFITEKVAFGECSQDVIIDEFKDLLLLCVLLQ